MDRDDECPYPTTLHHLSSEDINSILQWLLLDLRLIEVPLEVKMIRAQFAQQNGISRSTRQSCKGLRDLS